ncbi:MAG TPA: tetratricopeptide repeat protein [Candidatus Polarisedimenticolia bacterium]|jgi:thioredoxin-like negative regulator of GroEL
MTQAEIQARIDRSLKILESAPANHLARFGLANALFDAGRIAEAEPEYRRCLESQPEWMAVAIQLGRCLVMTGRHGEARQVLSSARDMAIRQGHSGPLAEIAELEERCR